MFTVYARGKRAKNSVPLLLLHFNSMDQKENNQQEPSKEQKKIALKKILQYLKDQKKENHENKGND